MTPPEHQATRPVQIDLPDPAKPKPRKGGQLARPSHGRSSAFIAVLTTLGVVLGGCETLPSEPEPAPAPVVETPAEPPPPSPPPPYQVQYGDTLSTIAAKLGIDYLALAEVNGLEPPYAIFEGQVLTIALDNMTPEQLAAVDDARREMVARANEAVQKTAETEREAQSTATEEIAGESPAVTINSSDRGYWQWPATGPVVAEFSGANQKGIDIAGERSSPIYSAADGVVQHVYDDAPQYGRLLIINHGEQYLGFYGHTERILVNVGDTVTRGQLIAEMGDSGTDSVKLHFQLRKNATPIDPRSALPEL